LVGVIVIAVGLYHLKGVESTRRDGSSTCRELNRAADGWSKIRAIGEIGRGIGFPRRLLLAALRSSTAQRRDGLDGASPARG
jgi:hypothetical protein